MGPKFLNILCVGDSLTSGSPSQHSYAIELSKKLEGQFPGCVIEYEVQGKPGDQVTQGGFKARLQEAWAVTRRPFDWTIILGGTNDVTWKKPSNAIVEALMEAWGISLSRGGQVLAMTIPEYRLKSPTIDRTRDEVNTAILLHNASRFHQFDLFTALPYHRMSPADRVRYWYTDGVHLTPAGYDFMGDKIADALAGIIKAQYEAPGSPSRMN